MKNSKFFFWFLAAGAGMTLDLVSCTSREDFQGGTRLIYQLDFSLYTGGGVEKAARDSKMVMEERLQAYGLKKFRVRAAESDRLAVETPGEVSAQLKDILSRSGRLTFRLVAPDEENRPEKIARWEEEERV